MASKEKKKFEYPCLYLLIYRRIREKANGRHIISHSEVVEVMGRNIPHIPQVFRNVMLKEMEDFCLIRRIDKQKVQLLAGNADAKLEKYTHILWE